jgi:ADP-heptose:LPS heptosyltransferase
MPAKYKTQTDRFYTDQLLLPTNLYFEFYKVRAFFEKVLGEAIDLQSPVINIERGKKNGIIIVIGAGVTKRAWEPEKFIALIGLMRQHCQQPVYLCGGQAEIQAGNFLTNNLPPNSVNNLTGKTSLTQLIDLIAKATLVVTNETGAAHIAAAVKTSSVCILGGGHFGRFAPYPEIQQHKQTSVYEKMECYNCNWNCKFETLKSEPFPCISNVAVSQVWEAVLHILEEERQLVLSRRS